MTSHAFIAIFKQIISEFRYLNQHFDSKESSKISEYNTIFENWKRDMYRFHKELIFDMHWGTSSPLIANNQILFDVRYQGVYLCEIKYRFDPKFAATFIKNVHDALDIFKIILGELDNMIELFEVDENTKTSEYDTMFNFWKKGIVTRYTYIVVDIHWEKSIETIKDNILLFNIMYQDDCLFEVKNNLYDEKKKIKSLDE